MKANIGGMRASTLVAIPMLCCSLLLLSACPKPDQETSAEAGVSEKQGWYVKLTHKIKWDPPGSYLVDFDATQALLNLSLTNATISSTTGTAQVAVKDLTTGQIVGQQSFGYRVNGNSIYAQDPPSVYNWLQQFTGYPSIDVIVTLDTEVRTTSAGSAFSLGTVQYLGTTYAAASTSWEYLPPPPDPPPCPPCPPDKPCLPCGDQ